MSASMLLVRNEVFKIISLKQIRCFHKTVMSSNKPVVQYFGRAGSPNKLTEIQLEGERFRLLVIPGHTETPNTRERNTRTKKETPPARYKSMDTNQDWTKVWPTAHSFKWSVVPFPVRMGVAKGEENDGIPPAKYANAELMKIPNFLHLTPPQIKKHCNALKAFCSKWPEELNTDEEVDEAFPVEIISHEYIRDAPTHRDIRARKVTLKVKLSTLDLNYHARDKLLRLVKDRYDAKTDIITFHGDRCPMRKQNYNYVHYLLTAVFHESWKIEPWESEKELADMEYYSWDINPSKKVVTETLKHMSSSEGESKQELTSEDEEMLLQKDSVQDFKSSIESLHNDGEDVYALNRYKDSVKKLLIPDIS